MKQPTKNTSTRVFLVDKFICNYISSEWFAYAKSDREIARLYGIHHNLVGKIKHEDGYNIPVSTLATICFNRGVKLSEFFNLLEEKYGHKINDDYISKRKQ